MFFSTGVRSNCTSHTSPLWFKVKRPSSLRVWSNLLEFLCDYPVYLPSVFVGIFDSPSMHLCRIIVVKIYFVAIHTYTYTMWKILELA